MEFGFASLIEVSKADQIQLVLVAIELSEWQLSGSRDKIDLCYENIQAKRNSGGKCILLWEDYWISKKEIVKSRLQAMLGISQKIPARLTRSARIHKDVTNDFIDSNHLNGAVSSKTRYGLFLPKRYFRVLDADFNFDAQAEELLVAVATFSYPRIFQQGDQSFKSYELIRFASLLGTNVVGGLDKLLHAFMDEKNPGDIMTYADLDWSDGRSYKKLGFEMTGLKDPETYQLDIHTMKRSLNAYIKDENNDVLTPEKTDKILIYNMGSMKYVKKIEV
jgi:hypothetical protein